MKNPFKYTNFILVLFITLMMLGCAPSPERDTETYANDAWISSKVKSKLLADPEVSGLDIQVETFNGVVQLSGFVASEAQIQEAIKLTRSVEGVREVENKLEVVE